MKLKVLAVSNQGKMTPLKIAQFPTHICIRLQTLPGCGSKPKDKQDVGLISWQKQEAVVRNGVEKDHEKYVHQSNCFDLVLRP